MRVHNDILEVFRIEESYFQLLLVRDFEVTDSREGGTRIGKAPSRSLGVGNGIDEDATEKSQKTPTGRYGLLKEVVEEL